MRNRYIFRARISEARFRRILRLFALDLNAMQIAALSGCSRVTINRYLRVLRERGGGALRCLFADGVG